MPQVSTAVVDWEIAAIDFRLDEGMLMAPGRAIPRLLARHGLAFGDIALCEVVSVSGFVEITTATTERLRRGGVRRRANPPEPGAVGEEGGSAMVSPSIGPW